MVHDIQAPCDVHNTLKFLCHNFEKNKSDGPLTCARNASSDVSEWLANVLHLVLASMTLEGKVLILLKSGRMYGCCRA
jgi:hypothetical protein